METGAGVTLEDRSIASRRPSCFQRRTPAGEGPVSPRPPRSGDYSVTVMVAVWLVRSSVIVYVPAASIVKLSMSPPEIV